MHTGKDRTRIAASCDIDGDLKAIFLAELRPVLQRIEKNLRAGSTQGPGTSAAHGATDENKR